MGTRAKSRARRAEGRSPRNHIGRKADGHACEVTRPKGRGQEPEVNPAVPTIASGPVYQEL